MSRPICISVIDEADTFTQAVFDQDWVNFRTAYPDRIFWLLQPGRPGAGMRVPADYTADPDAYGPIQVNRDDGNVANRSDWFAICQLDAYPPGSVLSLWVDISGSMTFATVQASYDYFVQRCADAQIDIVFETSASGERWIPDHIRDIPPSANFTANPESYQLGSGTASSTLSWLAFGDVTSVTIDQGIGLVGLEGNLVVNPTETTTYSLTAIGPAGTSIRTVTIIVTAPPPPSVTFSADPLTYISPGNTTLTWAVTGINISSISINNGVGNVATEGSTVVSPNVSTVYTITAENPGGTTTASVTITVFDPVVASISASPNPVIAGQSTTLSWVVTGDASQASINQGIGNVLFKSNTIVAPSTTTTYTLSASGNGGTDSDSVIVQVCQIPEITANFPLTTDFNTDFDVDITYRYASGGVTILAEYIDDRSNVTYGNFTLPATDSDESGASITEIFNSNIPWSGTGPITINYTLSVSGCGGVTTIGPYTVNVDIDKLPDLINIPDSLGVPILQDPVESPEDDVLLSDPIEITGIDIEVEITASKPIQVRFDNDDPNLEANWKSLRQIT